ncbi:hypothetical protein ACN4EK_32485, partial [Pantanalinema rosaneae CENA516]|uniref:hypothetical protein n=1 Tax=Pantanalinema rosaneae TaxID=1620701 RepID=UPI003D6E141C
MRRDEDRLVAALNAATEEAARLRAAQADALRGLARVRLDALTREQTTRELDSAERAALEILERRKTALQRAAESRRAFTLALARGQDERRSAQEAVEQAAARIDDLRENVQADLESDEPWLVQRRKLTHAKEVARAAGEKATRTEAEKAQKAAPYEADPLFTYLWERGFGTPRYRASPIVRFFDGRVARLIGYEEARANYHMLTEIPLRLRGHADRLAEEIDAEAAALAAIERAALEARGVGALETALAEAEAALDAVEASIAEAETGLARLDAEDRAAATGGGDPMMREALDLLSAALAADDLRRLQQEAAATPTIEDDALVVRLRQIAEGITRADEKVEEARRAAVAVGARR